MTVPKSNGKTVLVTGINGYIAGVLGHLLLSKGYSLRGTCRNAKRVDSLLRNAYKPFVDAGRVEIVEVQDMTVDGAFDEAVKGVDGIFHTASPLNFSHLTYEQTVGPAVRGTLVILDSALKAGPQLSAVVVTSSVSAVVDAKPPGSEYVFTEKDFADAALKQAEAEKNKPPGTTSSNTLYIASKTAAERELWRWRDVHKPPFHVSTINPAVVTGPPVQTPASVDVLNETLKPIYNIYTGSAIRPAIGSGTFVDVRDVAYMHVWSYEHSAVTDGQRYLAVSGYAPQQAIADSLREAYPDRRGIIDEGTPGEGYVGFSDGKVDQVGFPRGRVRVSGQRAHEVMGVDFIPFKKSILDTVEKLKPLF